MKVQYKTPIAILFVLSIVFFHFSCNQNQPSGFALQKSRDSLNLMLDSTEKELQKDPNNTYQLIQQIHQTATELQQKDIQYKCLIQSGIFYSITGNLDYIFRSIPTHFGIALF